MKASKDATAKTLEGVAKMDKNHEHSLGMQESIETIADLTELEKKGLDRKTNHQELVKAEMQPRGGEAATLERHDATEVVSLMWLAPSYVEHEATSQEGVMNFMPCLKSLERVGTVRNTIPEELERCGLFKKSKTHVAKPNALDPESVFGMTFMSDKHPEESRNVARCEDN